MVARRVSWSTRGRDHDDVVRSLAGLWLSPQRLSRDISVRRYEDKKGKTSGDMRRQLVFEFESNTCLLKEWCGFGSLNW